MIRGDVLAKGIVGSAAGVLDRNSVSFYKFCMTYHDTQRRATWGSCPPPIEFENDKFVLNKQFCFMNVCSQNCDSFYKPIWRTKRHETGGHIGTGGHNGTKRAEPRINL